MLKQVITTAVLSASVCAVSAANAAMPPGLYIAGAVGYADTSNVTEANNNGLAAKVTLGYQPKPHFAAEIAASNFATAVTGLTIKRQQISIVAKKIAPITDSVSLFAQLGGVYTKM